MTLTHNIHLDSPRDTPSFPPSPKTFKLGTRYSGSLPSNRLPQHSPVLQWTPSILYFPPTHTPLCIKLHNALVLTHSLSRGLSTYNAHLGRPPLRSKKGRPQIDFRDFSTEKTTRTIHVPKILPRETTIQQAFTKKRLPTES